MLKKYLLVAAFFLLPLAVSAQDTDDVGTKRTTEKIFPAEVIKIIKEENTLQSDGTFQLQQNVELKGLSGDYKGKMVEVDGIGDPESINKNIYQVGDKVSIEASSDEGGNIKYYITDYIRTTSLMWLTIVFVISLLIVGRWKGLRSLAALAVTILVVMKYIVPQIMDGSDPLIVTLLGSLAILFSIIYITDGFSKTSHVSVVSIFISLLLAIGLSQFFVSLTRLSGLANEEASFLVGYGGQIVNFKGLLLAGIIIGTLGVLDDVVLSQVTAVDEINDAGSGQTRTEIFKKAMKIGVSHISAMTNTLFLAYAGASLPLLILFSSGQSAFASPLDALNNEALATEVVRTLTGSIALVLAMPISTLLAVWQVKRK